VLLLGCERLLGHRAPLDRMIETMPANRPAVSVIIPCRNHAEALARCLDSVMSQQVDGTFEVIVVDAAADERVAEVVGRYPRARITRSAGNGNPLLPGPARNLGASTAAGTYQAFIDADCAAAPGWLSAALSALKSGAVMAGGPVLHGKPWHPVAVIDNLMQFSDMGTGRPRGAARLLPSCNLAMAREEFETVGGFPAVDLAAGEDVLFCNRAADRWQDRMFFFPTMQVRHFGRSTLRELWAHQYRFGFVRAMYGLELSARHRRLGRFAVLAPAVGLKRLGYIAGRAVRWQPLSLLAMVLFFPILLLGMTAWCAGFHRGCGEWQGR
jgi:glycosyltransferase involved in cell wall biosynthesis